MYFSYIEKSGGVAEGHDVGFLLYSRGVVEDHDIGIFRRTTHPTFGVGASYPKVRSKRGVTGGFAPTQ